MKKILTRTGFTQEQYTDIVFKVFLSCMSELSVDAQHLQLLLINKPINKWLLREVKKLNKDFLKTTLPYSTLTKKDIAIAYVNFIKRMSKNYPSALVKKVTVNPSLTHHINVTYN